jgi:lysophospholipase L1-like esterase
MNSYKLFQNKVLIILFISCNSSNNFEENIIKVEDSYINSSISEIGIKVANENPYNLLALGDSYTIGEGVDEAERWPNQFKEVASKKGIEFNDPIIIAETGWKTFDLLYEINRTKFSLEYDYISLLIGVNNQFNSRPIKEFEEDLEKLLDKMKKIIKDQGNIIIISIPDWGYTPFGENYNRESISNEIDRFNNSLKKFANINDLKFVDVTDISRRAIYQSNLITKDNLHPSGLMYLLWAQKIYNTWIN